MWLDFLFGLRAAARPLVALSLAGHPAYCENTRSGRKVTMEGKNMQLAKPRSINKTYGNTDLYMSTIVTDGGATPFK